MVKGNRKRVNCVICWSTTFGAYTDFSHPSGFFSLFPLWMNLRTSLLPISVYGLCWHWFIISHKVIPYDQLQMINQWFQGTETRSVLDWQCLIINSHITFQCKSVVLNDLRSHPSLWNRLQNEGIGISGKGSGHESWQKTQQMEDQSKA